MENTLDETRRGEEEPEFFVETSVKGDKKYHKFQIGFDKFNRHSTKQNGNAYFRCDFNGCSSRIEARYPSFDTWQGDIPEITSGPTPHMVQGVEHPPEKGKRLKELASKKIKDGMKADPLKSVPQIQEDVVNEMMESLGDQVEREEFIRSMPKPGNALRSLYSARGQIIPPTTATCREIDLTTRYSSLCSSFDSSSSSMLS